MIMEKKHTFAICAYKESKYLETCIQSLIPQSGFSEIIMCTSTPNAHIKELAERYNIPLLIREGKSDIQDDWNFACDQAKTPWVTVAHQDDVYDMNYAKELLEAIEKRPDAIVAFTDYHPIKHGQISTDLNSRVKRIVRLPMKNQKLANNKFFKKYFQGFGNAVVCPSIAYNKEQIQGEIFTSELKFALDWDTLVKFSYYDNPFIYIPKVLLYYRIHDEATSKAYTDNDIRKNDEMYMFQQFWPDWLIRIGYHLFKLSYQTYED